MNEDEKTVRRKEMDQKRAELLSLENEAAIDEKIDEETLNKKIGDLTVQEFLDIISKTSVTPDNKDIFTSTMEMMKDNPSLMKNMMGLMGNMRF